MTYYGLAIDPGMSTGVCLFSWGTNQSAYFRVEGVWQFDSGAEGLRGFIEASDTRVVAGRDLFIGEAKLSALVVEKFTPRGGSEFSLTQASVEPLRGEGVLIGQGFGPFITWQQPGAQYFMGGVDLPSRKKRSREFLKLNGLYLTGRDVLQKDADDAISAELHAIAFLRKIRHMPTLTKLFTTTTEEG